MLLLVVLVSFPGLLLALFVWKPSVALSVLAVAAIVWPVAASLWLPDYTTVEQNVISDPAGMWARDNCRGLHGVALLMKDARPGQQPRWWVMCRDGSKAAVVTPEAYPRRLEPNRRDFIRELPSGNVV